MIRKPNIASATEMNRNEEEDIIIYVYYSWLLIYMTWYLYKKLGRHNLYKVIVIFLYMENNSIEGIWTLEFSHFHLICELLLIFSFPQHDQQLEPRDHVRVIWDSCLVASMHVCIWKKISSTLIKHAAINAAYCK